MSDEDSYPQLLYVYITISPQISLHLLEKFSSTSNEETLCLLDFGKNCDLFMLLRSCLLSNYDHFWKPTKIWSAQIFYKSKNNV